MPIDCYEVERVQTDVPTIEIDTDIWTQENLDEYREFIDPKADLDDVLENIVHNVIMFDSPSLIEGVGYMKYDGHLKSVYEGGAHGGAYRVPEESEWCGINVRIGSPDVDYEVTKRKSREKPAAAAVSPAEPATGGEPALDFDAAPKD